MVPTAREAMSSKVQAQWKRPFVLLVTAAVLLLVAFMATIFGGQYGSGLGLAAVFGIPGAWLLLRSAKWAIRTLGKADLFSPVVAFPIGYILWFGFASISLLDDPDPLPYRYFVTGLVFYLAGVWLCRRCSRQVAVTGIPSFWKDWVPSRFVVAVTAFGVLAFAGYVYLIWNIGIPGVSPDAGEQRLKLLNYGPVNAVFFSSAWTTFVFLVLHLRQSRMKKVRRFFVRILLVVISLMLLSLGSRGYFFIPFLTALIACYYIGPRFKLRSLFIVGVLVFTGLSVYGFVRETYLTRGFLSVGEGGSVHDWLFPLIYGEVYVRQPVATFREITQLIPRGIPYRHGALTFGALKTLLPGHHEMSDMYFKRILGHEFIGFGEPATLLGPFYGDFGVIGVAVGMLLFGVVFAKLHMWMMRNPSTSRAAIYGWAVQTALFSLFGALIPYITTLWVPVLWYLVSFWVAQAPRPMVRVATAGVAFP
jgi:oligosaccharide repeat unit polymerase